MTDGPIRLVNEDGRIVGKDPETGETVPIELGSVDAADALTDELRVGRTQAFGRDREAFAAGRIPAARWASWSMQIGQSVASFPVNKTTPVLILHSEGGRAAEYEETLPRMRERQIPWEFGIGDSTAFADDLDASGHVGPDQAREIMLHGAEVGLYTGEVEELSPEQSPWTLADEQWGVDDTPGGLDPDRDGATIERLVRLLQGQKRHIETQVGANVSFMTARDGTAINTGELDMAKAYAIRSLFQASGHGFQPSIGNGSGSGLNVVHPHGVSSYHLEQAANEGDVEGARAVVDQLAATDGGRGLFFFHSHAVEDWDSWEAIVDYAVRLRDRGELDIASATGGLVLPWDLREGNVLMEPDPRSQSFSDSFWSAFGNTPDVRTIGAGDYWAVGADFGGEAFGGLRVRGLSARLQPFPTFMAAADVRAPDGATTDLTIRYDPRGLETVPDDERWRIDAEFAGIGDGWERVRTPFGVPRADVGDPNGNTLDNLAFWSDSGEAHVTNLAVYPC